MRTIDADALKEKLQEHHDFYINAWKENGVAPIDIPIPDKSRLDEIINSIAEVVNAPTIEERPKGKWIKSQEEFDDAFIIFKHECSNCKEITFGGGNFCPNCGARMESDI